jgi:hypothetical protein
MSKFEFMGLNVFLSLKLYLLLFILTANGFLPGGSGNTIKVKVKISLLQAVEAHRVARGQGSHIT